MDTNEVLSKTRTLIRLKNILNQMHKERAYVKTKPYSMTLTEQLYEEIAQYKLF